MSSGELSLQSLAADFAILRAENATLKARADKSDARADKADARADKSDARADKADARADKSDAENADLKAKVEELMKANNTSSTAPPPPPEEELMTRYSSRWRLLFFIGGTIPSAFAVYGYVKDDERSSWAAGTFWAFSSVCLVGAAFGNPEYSKLERKAVCCNLRSVGWSCSIICWSKVDNCGQAPGHCLLRLV